MITIENALVDLSIQLEVKRRLGEDHQAASILLGMEALKRCKYIAEHTDRWAIVLLPGEKEE